LYTFFKLLHVITAIAWVGGGLTLLAANIVASKVQGEEGAFKVLDIMNVLGKTWFVPVSFLTVIFGAIATTLGGAWGEFWVILGLAGFASTFFTGLLVIEPQGRRIGAAMAEGRVEDAKAAADRLMQVARFDYTVMLVVIIDMVIKPDWSDFVAMAIMAALIAAGAVAFLGLGRNRQVSAA
jgi:hypothetical protein